MASNRSFKDYVVDRFYNELFVAIQSFTAANYEDLDLRLYRVRNIGSIELSDIEAKFVSVNDLPDMKIEFDVAVEAELEVREADYHYDESEFCKQWFMLKCTGDLDCNLDDLIIFSVTKYVSKNKQPKPMSDFLVPFINKEQLEDEATEFLRKYYPEALKKPMAIEPDKLAKRMGLDIKIQRITEDFSVFGQIFFFDKTTELYDSNSCSMVQTDVLGKTIIVDPQNFFLRNLGSVNNTIVHECVHWDKHRKAFELERLFNKDVTQIKCQVVGGIKDNKVRSATDWMEWQANALAPRIQMPLIPFKMKVNELIRKCRDELSNFNLVDIMEWVIDEAALFYGVSRCAAKIRMVDIGYDQAIGVFTYVDNHYVKPHCFKKGSIQKNQTFSISIKDAIVESIFKSELKEKLSSGNYLYVDSHFCFNHPKYIQFNENGTTELTDYARFHMEECCLVFDLKIKSVNKYGEQFFTECVLYRDAASSIVFEAHYSSENKDNLNHTEMIKQYNADLLSVARKLPMNFSGALDALIKWSEMTEEELAEAAEMSEKTIQRLRNDEPDNVTIETVVQLCIGMKLPPMLSNCLLRASGKSFMMTEQHLMYQFLLNSCYTKSIYECNDMLVSQDLKPLGRQNRVA
ncbi:ImmA/IrrE family metallo-endopeptidase [Anaeromicropila populeti]|uniref:Cro/C1-type HTH DNA-binding domain-containing protein n=1 Tax=Anaeromicropila populeti TaxID=37658 RepID=A0A1I6LZ70_9FIRM|nr:helix-turn-helix domain-containing protein [Anaeromicropila populeti]SFS08733.1 Cro/C1-type HTH DNA-binding domain-containing protein [Anaeromicropila populeti]